MSESSVTCRAIRVAGKLQCYRCDMPMTFLDGNRICEKSGILRERGGHVVSNPIKGGTFFDPDGVGTIYKEDVAKWGAKSCTDCEIRAKEMNLRGPQWCEDNLEMLVKASDKLAQKNPSVLGYFARLSPDITVQYAIRNRLKAAIKESKRRKGIE